MTDLAAVARRLLWSARFTRFRAEVRLRGFVRSNPLFDPAWYAWQYPEVRESGSDPREHYRASGVREGRDPNAVFDTRWYIAENPDVLAKGIDPVDHYLVYGAREGRDPSPQFDSEWYLRTYPDVRTIGINPLLHYLRYGLREGRRPTGGHDAVPRIDPAPDTGRRDPGDRRPVTGFAACTIIARNYLSHARILAESFQRYHPDGRFYLLVVDGSPDGVSPGPGIQLIGPRELEHPDLVELSFKYNVTEFSTAVKPTLIQHIMRRFDEPLVFYFDPDILITRRLTELEPAIEHSTVLLIPHILQPIPLDGRRPSEQDILVAGAYNLGFIGVRRTDVAVRFLEWWEARLRDHCRKAPAEGLMVDQRWIDLVPSLFGDSAILRDDTYDVAYWNLNSRTVGARDGTYTVNGRPLSFFHFSGFDPLEPHELSRHQDRIVAEPGSPLAGLLHLYAQLQVRHGHSETSRWEYGYDRLRNGVRIHQILRELYQGLSTDARRGFGDPFDARGAESFFTWATTAGAGKLTPFQDRLLRSRPDFAAEFPDAATTGREDFLSWLRERSATLGLDPVYLSAGSARARSVLPGGRSAPTASASSIVAPASGRDQEVGVNLVGYLRNESGVGAVARGYLRLLRALGVPVSLIDVSHLSPHRSPEGGIDLKDGGTRFGINLVVVNADQHPRVRRELGTDFFRSRYTVGVWQWEAPTFPSEWSDRFADYDEIWAGSSFVTNAIATVSPIPVVRMLPPLTPTIHGQRDRGRKRLGISPDENLFTFMFDFRSHFERKNPTATVNAFLRAFPSGGARRLVIKCVNEDFDPGSFKLLQDVATDPRVSVRAGHWSAQEIADFMEAGDAYISLHRSEGIGLTLAEAMARGKSVIATGWSGNMDFMSISNSYPVGYDLAEVAADVGPYKRGVVWAEPSVEHASELMRAVVDGGDAAGRRTKRAAHDIAELFSEDALREPTARRLLAIEPSLRLVVDGSHGGTVPNRADPPGWTS